MSIEALRALVEDSHVGLVIFTENYQLDPKALLELASVLVADKPMYMLVKRGVILSERLRWLAKDIEFFDDNDFKLAAAKLTSRMKARLESGEHGPRS